MENIKIGVLLIVFSFFLIYISPREKYNAFGYKSLLSKINKYTWEWTNRLFGIFLLIGSFAFLFMSIYFKITNNNTYDDLLKKYGLIYIIVVTLAIESFGFIRFFMMKIKRKKDEKCGR